MNKFWESCGRMTVGAVAAGSLIFNVLMMISFILLFAFGLGCK